MTFAFIFSSFLAGLLTFFAPCTFPLVPAFLAVIAGVNLSEMKPEGLKKMRGKIMANAMLYILGFSVVFIAFGIGFSFLGRLLLFRVWLERISGLIIIIFDLFTLGVLRISWLSRERQISQPRLFARAGLLNSFLLGFVFALSWSPCVGPILGSILLLASHTATVGQGIFLLVIFSMGLGLPFLVMAYLIGSLYNRVEFGQRAVAIATKIAGVLLLILGSILLSNHFGFLLGHIEAYFLKFTFFDRLINSHL